MFIIGRKITRTYIQEFIPQLLKLISANAITYLIKICCIGTQILQVALGYWGTNSHLASVP